MRRFRGRTGHFPRSFPTGAGCGEQLGAHGGKRPRLRGPSDDDGGAGPRREGAPVQAGRTPQEAASPGLRATAPPARFAGGHPDLPQLAAQGIPVHGIVWGETRSPFRTTSRNSRSVRNAPPRGSGSCVSLRGTVTSFR